MRIRHIGLFALALALGTACGSSGGDSANNGSDGTGASDGTNGGGDGNGNSDGTSGDGTNGDGTTGDGNTGDGTSGDGTSGDGSDGAGGGDAGSSGDGNTGTGACLNDADQAVLKDLTVQQLACEGAACVGKSIDFMSVKIDEAKTAMCVSADAPNLSKLSTGCQQCFTQISLCVPKNCVQLLGASSNACGSFSLPNTEFSKCTNPEAPKPECEQCQMDNCQQAFVDCSGITQ